MSTLKYEAICNELDTLSIAYLDKISEYHEQWKDTSEHFQQVKFTTCKKKGTSLLTFLQIGLS